MREWIPRAEDVISLRIVIGIEESRLFRLEKHFHRSGNKCIQMYENDETII